MFFFGQSKIISLQCHFIFIVKISFLFATVNFILSLGLFTTFGRLWRNSVKSSWRSPTIFCTNNWHFQCFKNIESVCCSYWGFASNFKTSFTFRSLNWHVQWIFTLIFSFFLQFLAHLLHFLLVPIYPYTSARKHSKAPYAYNCGR